MIQDEVNKFFANKPNPPKRIKVGGKLSVSNLNQSDQELIKKRLAEKDPIMQIGKEGIIPGLLIDGKQVTKESIKELEIDSKKEIKKEEKLEEIVKPSEEKKVEKKEEVVKEKKKKTTKKK